MSGLLDLRLGFSPCPNDTFIFCALANGQIDTPGARLHAVIEDVEALNRRAVAAELEITKISFHAYLHLRDRYQLLDAGSALGRGCGPLVVSRRRVDPESLRRPDPLHPGKGPIVAIPGHLTTAALLFRLFSPGPHRLEAMPFDQIFEAVLSGRADLGVIIHEGRFTFAQRGLSRVVDLGEWWESETGNPIPLGGIIARRDLGEERVRQIDGWVRESVARARRDPASTRPYVRAHAQELAEDVIRAHIDLYVNRFTDSLGEEGRAAIDVLSRMAEERGIVPPSMGTTAPR